MITAVEIKAPTVGTPEPHFIPGYSGHCPEYVFRVGDTYGNTTHKVLLDPRVNHAEKTIISERTTDDFQVFRPHERNIDIVNSRFRQGDVVYKHPMAPGYEGFIPRINGQFGQRFSVLATEAISQMAEQQIKDKGALLQVQREMRVQSNSYSPTTAEDRQLVQSEFKLPLLEVRPQLRGILRNLPVDEPVAAPTNPGLVPTPYFKDCLDPEKKFITGTEDKLTHLCEYIHINNNIMSNEYLRTDMNPEIRNSYIRTAISKQSYAGHVPYGYSRYGEGYQPYTNSALCDFTSNYRRRQSTEWAPVNITRPDPPLMIQPSEIYPKHIGMLPNYRGHIPGAMFRYGKTFGNDSRDAKRWLRGDFTS